MAVTPCTRSANRKGTRSLHKQVRRVERFGQRANQVTRMLMRVRFGHVSRLIFTRFKHTDMSTPVNKTAHLFDKARLEALLNRRFFYAPAFEIYGGAQTVPGFMTQPLLTDPTQASQDSTTTAHPDPRSKRTSSPNGVAISSSTITCSSSIRPS